MRKALPCVSPMSLGHRYSAFRAIGRDFSLAFHSWYFGCPGLWATGRLSVEGGSSPVLPERQGGTCGDADCSRIGAGVWVLLDRYLSFQPMALPAGRARHRSRRLSAPPMKNLPRCRMPWSGWTFLFPWRWNALGTAGNATLLRRKRPGGLPQRVCIRPCS